MRAQRPAATSAGSCAACSRTFVPRTSSSRCRPARTAGSSPPRGRRPSTGSSRRTPRARSPRSRRRRSRTPPSRTGSSGRSASTARSGSCPASSSISDALLERLAGGWPSDVGGSLELLAEVAQRLRSPDGCPWDREQTHASLRPLLLEEVYEAMDAIDSGDPAALREELGALLFHVVIHAQLANEAGAFDLAAVARTAGEKLVRRHPHVFGGAELDGDLLAQWERIKREERADKGTPEQSILDG